MGYRIDYGAGKPKAEDNRRSWLCLAAFAVFLGLVIRFWPGGRRAAAEFLFPGGAERACQAAEIFARDLGAGMPVREAAEAFCRDILSGAGIP